MTSLMRVPFFVACGALAVLGLARDSQACWCRPIYTGCYYDPCQTVLTGNYPVSSVATPTMVGSSYYSPNPVSPGVAGCPTSTCTTTNITRCYLEPQTSLATHTQIEPQISYVRRCYWDPWTGCYQCYWVPITQYVERHYFVPVTTHVQRCQVEPTTTCTPSCPTSSCPGGTCPTAPLAGTTGQYYPPGAPSAGTNGQYNYSPSAPAATTAPVPMTAPPMPPGSGRALPTNKPGNSILAAKPTKLPGLTTPGTRPPVVWSSGQNIARR